jgi:hypothetical protein
VTLRAGYTAAVLRAWSLALTMASAGCLSTPGPAATPDATDAPTSIDGPACPDGDSDGWTTCGRYPDCADGDAAIHPGAFERIDGADRDCAASEPAAEAPVLGYLNAGGLHTFTTATAVYQLDTARGGQLASLRLGGTEHLYRGSILENFAGVLAWNPTNNVSRSVAASGPGLTVITTGRGVALVEVGWTAGRLTGTSRFTITVDGRLVRGDDFTVTEDVGLTGVTSYTALDATRLTGIAWEELGGTVNPTQIAMVSSDASEFALAGNANDDGFLCANSSANELLWTTAVAPTAGGAGQPRRGLRATRNRSGTTGPTEQVALQYDWEFAPISGGRRIGYAALWAGPTVDTACLAGESRMRAFRTPLTLGDGAGYVVSPLADRDVNGDGFIEDGGFWSITPTGGPVRFHFTGAGVHENWKLIHLRGPGFERDVVVEREAGDQTRTRLIHGQDYLADPDGDGGLWLSVRGLTGADFLEIWSPAASAAAP